MWPADPLHTLTVGEASEGVTLTTADGSLVSVPYDECEALLKWPDGHRVLMAADAFTLAIDPRRWVDGREAHAEIDARVPVDRHVEMPPVPEAEKVQVPALPEPGRNWFGVIFLGLIELMLVLIAVLAPGGSWVLAVLFGGLWWLIIRELRKVRAARGLRGLPKRRSASNG